MGIRKRIEAKLAHDEFIFDPTTDRLEFLESMTQKGVFPVCHRCGARLLYALTPEEARDKKVPPGVFCPKFLSHCQIVVEFGGIPRIPHREHTPDEQ